MKLESSNAHRRHRTETQPAPVSRFFGTRLIYRSVRHCEMETTLSVLRFIVFCVVAAFSPSLCVASDWEGIGHPYGVAVDVLHTHPRDQDLVFAESRNTGIFRSMDGGRTWSECFVGGFSLSTSAFSVSQDNPDIMVVIGTWNKMYRSSDGCATWNELRQAPHSHGDGPFAMTIPPERPRVILVAFDTLYRSVDGGQEWDTVDSVPFDHFTMIAADPVRIGTWWLVGRGGLYRSDNEGETWAEVPDVTYPRTMIFDPNDDERILVGTKHSVMRSANGGATFSVISTLEDNSSYRELAFDPMRPNRMWAVTEGSYETPDRLLKSDDAGETWTELKDPSLTSASLTDVEVQSDSDGVLVAQQHGIASSNDGGASWRSANDGFPGLPVGWGGILLLERDHQTILTASPMHTEDGGSTWIRPAGEIDFIKTREAEMTIDPMATETVYAVTDSGNLHRSIDAGVSFSRISQPDAWQNLVIDSGDPTIWYIVTYDGPNRSVDGGQTWVPIESGLPEDGLIYGLFADPWNLGVLLAIDGENNIYRSENRGESWHHLHTIVDSAGGLGLESDPTTPGRIYCTSQGGLGDEIHVTENGGLTWVKYGPTDPFDLNYFPRTIAPDPLVPGLVYGVASDVGIDYQTNTLIEFFGMVVSTDAGATWQVMSPPIEDGLLPCLGDLTVTADGVYLYSSGQVQICRLQLREPTPRRGGGRVEPD